MGRSKVKTQRHVLSAVEAAKLKIAEHSASALREAGELTKAQALTANGWVWRDLWNF